LPADVVVIAAIVIFFISKKNEEARKGEEEEEEEIRLGIGNTNSKYINVVECFFSMCTRRTLFFSTP
jgi:hypothetical protein